MRRDGSDRGRMRLKTAISALVILGCLFFAGGDALAKPSHTTSQISRVAALLHAYERWRGGAAFLVMRSAHSVGTQASQGARGPSERWITTADRYRMDSRIGAIRSSVRVGPAGAWKTVFSGQVQALSVEERADALREGRLLLPPPPASQRIAVLTGREAVDGQRVSVLSFREPSGDGIDYLLTADSALAGARLHSDGKARLVRYSDWRIVDGVRMPFLETETDQDGDEMITTITRVELNRNPAPAVFGRPQPTASVTFGANGSSGWLPFDFFEGERIFIEAIVNGRPTPVLLDSGAEATVLDRAFAAEAGMTSANETSATGLNATASAGVVPNVSIRLGTVEMRGLTVASIDLGTVSSQLRHPLPVILGTEIFRDAIVDIDFAGRRIAFSDPAHFIPPPGAVPATITPGGGLYMVEASAAGRPARLDLDLGSGSPLALWNGFWTRLDLAGPRSTTVIGGVGGFAEAGIAEVHHVRIGGADFPAVPTELMPAGGSGIARARSDGNIGLPLLKRFRLIVDLPHSRVWFLGPADTATPFAKDRSGLAMTPSDEGLSVLHVAARSPAAGAGIKVGDTVLTIDGVAAATLSIRRWGTGPAGSVHTLGMADGRSLSIKLADYF